MGLSLETKVIVVSLILGVIFLGNVLIPNETADGIIPEEDSVGAVPVVAQPHPSRRHHHRPAPPAPIPEPPALAPAVVRVPEVAPAPVVETAPAVADSGAQGADVAADVSAGAHCEVVSHTPEFETTLCYREASCDGHVTLRRKECPAFPKEVAREGDLHGLMHALGPDAFRVRLEGEEAIMVDMDHEGQCVYRGSFHMTLPGAYAVQAFTMFTDFHGHADWPFAKPIYAPKHVVRPGHTLQCAQPARPYVPPSQLPVCHNTQEPGRWVHPPGTAAKKGPHAPGWPMRWKSSGIVFAKDWGSHMQWQPYACRYQDYTQDEITAKLQGKRIAYIGDSQTRSMFYPLVNALNQNKILGNPKIVDQNPNNQGWIEFPVRGNILVRYYLDNFLAETKNSHSVTWHAFHKGTTKLYDIIIVGMGNWAMCGNLANKGVGLWSLQRYHTEIDRIARQLKEYATQTGTRIIWHNQPNFPWDVDAYRNGARLRLFNRYATDRMASTGFEIFDTFNISHGMLHTAVGYPAGHFNDHHVRENWARVLLSYLVDHPEG